MRRILLLALMLALSISAWAQNSYIHDGSIGQNFDQKEPVKKAQKVQIKKDPYPNIPMESWIGHRFIFLPSDKFHQADCYKNFKTDESDYGQLSYDKYVGRIAKVVSFEQKVNENTKENVIATVNFEMEDNKEKVSAIRTYGMIDSIALVSDIDNARSKLKGKTLWPKNILYKYNQQTDTAEDVHISSTIPVKVVDVVAGWTTICPVRLILQSAKGEVMFKDIQWSGTNSPGIQEDANLSSSFYNTKPKKIPKEQVYKEEQIPKRPPRILSGIKHHYLVIGMTNEEARSIWGDPEDINETVTSSGVHEQWVYKGGSYLYFDDGILTAIQN